MTQNLNNIFEEILGEDEFARPKFQSFLKGPAGFSQNKQGFFSNKFGELFESFQLDLTKRLAAIDQGLPAEQFEQRARQIGTENTFEKFFQGFDFGNVFQAADPLSAGRATSRFAPSATFVFR